VQRVHADEVGCPRDGAFTTRFDSDAREFGGSGYGAHARVVAEPVPWHGFGHSLRLRLPPLSALVLAPERA
jgi:1,4-alpha-glucan branching enzyme